MFSFDIINTPQLFRRKMMIVLKDMAKQQKSKLVFLAIFAVLVGASIIGQSYLLVTIIDYIFIKDRPFSDIIPLLIGLIFVLLVRSLFSYLSGRTGIKMASRVKRTLRKRLLQRYSASPIQTSIHGQSG